MKKHRILIIVGHPDTSSYCASLAKSYHDSAQFQGHEVKWIALSDLQFDPILRSTSLTIQPLEKDLIDAQAAIQWASHMVFAYPIWWWGMPALLKGFFDRVFLSGFAYRYRNKSIWWDKLLTVRSADLIVTLDTPAWYFRLIYRMPGHHQIKRTILHWCGIAPIKLMDFSPIKSSTPDQRECWRNKVIARAKSL